MASRRQKQKNVAESRAPVFARPESRPSTTPTGVHGLSSSSKNQSKESWPGPFATALDIISRREDAKRRRDEAIQNQSESGDTSDIKKKKLEHLDEYDQVLSTLSWEPMKHSRRINPIKRLNELCIEACAKATFGLTSDTITKIPEDSREKLLLQTAKLRSLSSQIALLFAIPNSGTLVIPECSQINEETLLQILNIIAPVASPTLSLAAHITSTTTANVTNNQVMASAATSVEVDSSSVVSKGKSKGKAKPSKSSRGKGKKQKEDDEEEEIVANDSTVEVLASAVSPVATTTVPSDDDTNAYISSATSSNNTTGVSIIQLHNAGLGFSDKVAASLISRMSSSSNISLSSSYNNSKNSHQQSQSSLEVLQVTGLYRLSDTALSNLLIACQDSLQHLDLTANSRFGELSLQSLRFDKLLSLCLDHVSHLTDEHLDMMMMAISGVTTGVGMTSPSLTTSTSSKSTVATFRMSIPSSSLTVAPVCTLESLSLNGLIHITDAGITRLLAKVGSSLQSLNLNSCSLLTDLTLISIRTYCHSLRHLDIGCIPSFTTPALIGLFVLDPALLLKQQQDEEQEDDEENDEEAAGNNNDDGVATDKSNVNSSNSSKQNSTEDDEEVTFIESTNNQHLPLVPENLLSSSILSIDQQEQAHQAIGRLESVSLQGLINVTDDVIIQLTLTSHQTLHTLNINNCHQVTCKSAVALAMNCYESLTSLDMSFVRHMKEDTLGYLLNKIRTFHTGGEIDTSSSSTSSSYSSPDTLLSSSQSSSFQFTLSVWSCTQLTKRFYSGISSKVHVIGKQAWL